MNKSVKRNPWAWIPTLYFAQGLPNVAVMTIAVAMYKNLGLSNTEVAFYTSWLYLPWTLKPIWSPFVDIVKTKRWWIVAMQGLIAAGFAGIAFFIPTAFYVKLTLAFFWLLAFSSATHDIAADGFYMLSLSSGEQSMFVGIRNTFFRLANIFGQGFLVMLAGWMGEGLIIPSIEGNIPLVWSLIFYLMAGLFIFLAIYHKFVLPHPVSDVKQKFEGAGTVIRGFFNTVVTFFQKKHLLLMFFFLLTYRLGEAQLAKMSLLFVIDNVESGGLGLSMVQLGAIYGTAGWVALLLGGIASGLLVSAFGFKKWILPMALAINLPDLLYVWLALAQPDSPWIVVMCVIIEQFGYGFGFTAYTLYLIYIAEGEYKTAHYAFGTGIMALGMMLPGMPAGWIQAHVGYVWFFVIVCLSTLPGIVASLMVRNKMEPSFGKFQKK